MFKTITANLMVESVEETIQFYEKILGFTVAVFVPDDKGKFLFTILTKDGTTIMAQEKNSLIEEYPVLKTDKVKPSISLYVVVDDIDAQYKNLKGKVKMLAELHETPYETREFAVADNNGYVVTFSAEKK